MKKSILIALVVIFALTSCADHKVINGVDYRPYGLLNEGSAKNDSVYYECSGWAILSGIIWSETAIVPIYVFGFNLWEPKMSMKEHNQLKGIK